MVDDTVVKGMVLQLRGPLPKSDVIEETSAMAQSDDPDDVRSKIKVQIMQCSFQPKSWDYDDIDEAK